MKAIVIGLGSMGRRRARLLQEYDSEIKIIGIDTRNERRKQAEDELGITTVGSMDKAVSCFGAVDVAFVSTSPLSHASMISECLNHNLHVFTEINLTDKGYDDNIALARSRGKVLFLSSTFLYRKEVQYIKSAVENAGMSLSYVYHAGQYLPDWHPWESYQNFFVGQRETNGCREFMAIEFPWIIDVFGDVKDMHFFRGRQSALDINFSDSYQIIFEHVSGHRGMIAIDIVSRKPVRNFELYGENLFLTWDGTTDGLYRYDYDTKLNHNIKLYQSVNRRTEYNTSIIEDSYLEEISNFMDVVLGRDIPRYSFEKDKGILSIIDKIEGR